MSLNATYEHHKVFLNIFKAVLCHTWKLTLHPPPLLPSFQGLYVFVVYFILHNQLCCPVKASYTVEMNGHTSPGSAFFTHGSGMPPAGAEISKSTQNLIAAMEEVLALLYLSILRKNTLGGMESNVVLCKSSNQCTNFCLPNKTFPLGHPNLFK